MRTILVTVASVGGFLVGGGGIAALAVALTPVAAAILFVVRRPGSPLTVSH